MANRKTATKKLPDNLGEKFGEASIPPPSTQLTAEAKAASDSEVMRAITEMQSVFSTKIDGVLSAIQDMKTEVRDFAGRLTEAEQRISNTEDDVGGVQTTVRALESQVKTLSARLDDLENRHRRNNLRLVNLPERAEGADAVKFLEKWFHEVFGDSLPGPVIIEQAHRIGRLPTSDQRFPRVLIMKFMNLRDRQRVMDAARERKTVMFQQHKVMFFPDFSVEVRKQRRQFDDVKRRLRALNIEYRLRYPAKLAVKHGGQMVTCSTTDEVERLIEDCGGTGGQEETT